MDNIIFFTPLHSFLRFSEQKPQEIFPYVLSMESSIQNLTVSSWGDGHMLTSKFLCFPEYAHAAQ